MEPYFRRILVRLLVVALGLCVTVLAGLAVLQVVLRYVFASPLMWVEEVSVMIMLWMTWLGISLLWLTKSHIVVDLLTNQLSQHVQKALASLIDILAVISGGTLFVLSQETLRTLAGLELDSLALDLAIKYYPVPTGALVLVLAAVINLWSRQSGQESEP
ncbi:MAG: TRAP transporter small permease subunit [Proteobacteria bacterium]|nr:TRAP transporter small permease subunit [Pseudomonadota bacterium]